MARFFLKLFLLSLPVIILLGLPAAAFIFTREYYNASDIVQAQTKNKNILYNSGTANIRKEYKRELIKEKPSEVVIIGTSRILAIRREFFKNPEKITNAGQIITSFSELDQVGKMIKDKTKFVIIGLDPQMFNPDFINQDIPSAVLGNRVERFGNLLGTYWKKFYSDLISGRVNVITLWSNRKTENIGLSSLQNLSGFRDDGSYEYGPSVWNNKHDERIKLDVDQSVDVLKANRSSYLYGTRISEGALNDIDSFLAFCKKNNIEVVGFMTPQPHRVYAEFKKVNDVYSYIQKELPKKVNTIFVKYGYKFLDLSDSEIIGVSENDFADPLHGGEEVYKKALFYMSLPSKGLYELLAS